MQITSNKGIRLFRNSTELKRTFTLLIVLVVYSKTILAQEKSITLNEVLEIAYENSLDSYKARLKYGVSSLEYKLFKSSLLPRIDFETRPITYNSSFIQRYDPINNIDIFRIQKNLNTFANLSVSQNIGSTGGKIFLNSSFNRLENFGSFKNKSFNTTPIRIGLEQPLMAFNEFKWKKKIDPLKYAKASKDLVYELQNININVVDYFFEWSLAKKRVRIAKENVVSSKKLYKIGTKRYELGTVEKNDLLNLELELYNANISLVELENDLVKVENDLRIYFREDLFKNNEPELPKIIPNLQIDAEKATSLANKNNPNILALELKRIEMLRDLDRVIKQNRFDLSISASYGLNQQANSITEAYGSFLDQQIMGMSFRVPIIDWGERKGNIKTARMNKEVNDIDNRQQEDRLRQEVSTIVNSFNIQGNLVEGVRKSSEIAKESYVITEKRFLSGRIDLLYLTNARKSWQLATEKYISNLSTYWRLYFEVQRLTLYDFINNTSINEDFEKIVK